MELPSAIAKQGEAADKLQESIAKGILVEAEVVKEEEPEATPAPEPEKAEKEKKEKKPEEKAPEPPKKEDWEHKFKVLQGKYNAEIPQLRDQVTKANATIANLNSLIVQLNEESKRPEQPEDGKPSTQLPSDAAIQGLNPSDFEGYGEEMVAMVNLVNQQAGIIQNLKSRIDNTETRVSKSEDQGFFSDLAKAVPDWEKVDADPGWLEWLAGVDPMSGIQRQVLLNDAREKFDAERTVRIFNSFKQEVGWQTQLSSPAPKEEVISEDETNPLEEQVAIESGPEGGPAEVKKGITREQYRQAVDDVTQNRITREDFEKISNAFQRSIKAGLTK
jgi:hypothetical protein